MQDPTAAYWRGRDDERAAIVAYLREMGEHPIAHDIERGDHLLKPPTPKE